MKSNVKSLTRRLLKDTSGQTMIIVAVGLFGLIGVSGLAIDMGGYYDVVQVLQASTNVAAIAGAAVLPDSNAATANVHKYSSETGGSNANSRLNQVTATPNFMCSVAVTNNLGIPCKTATGSYTGTVNAMTVVQTASVPLWFGRIFGVSTWPAYAKSTVAMKGLNKPANIAIIVDATLSQNTLDDQCEGANVTELQCETNGVLELLGKLYPCKPNLAQRCSFVNGVAVNSIHRVAIFSFPPVTIASAAVASNCTQTPVTNAWVTAHGGYYTGPSRSDPDTGWYDNATYGNLDRAGSVSRGGYYFESSKNSARNTGAWPYWPIGTTYTYPTIGAGTYHPTGATTGTYELSNFGNAGPGDANGFFSDYRANWVDGTPVSTSSRLVKMMGGVSGCGGVSTTNYDGNIGTYYAGALYAAQAALIDEQIFIEQTTQKDSDNVIIIMGDGNSTSQYSNSNYLPGMSVDGTGTYPSARGECGQAVVAAQYAASYGTDAQHARVFTIAYGSATTYSSGSNPRCGSDVGFGTTYKNITPCDTMRRMASSPDLFFTSNQSGSTNTCLNTVKPENNLSINAVFDKISAEMSYPRLIPNGTL